MYNIMEKDLDKIIKGTEITRDAALKQIDEHECKIKVLIERVSNMDDFISVLRELKRHI